MGLTTTGQWPSHILQQDKHTQKEKKWLAVKQRVDELTPYTQYYRGYRNKTRYADNQFILWLPLEKPVFAGWETWVTLSASARNRRDAPRLLAAIHAIGIDKPLFFKQVRSIRLLRDANYKYEQVKSTWPRAPHTTWVHHSFEPLFRNRITEKVYNGLAPDIKPYFEPRITPNEQTKKETSYYILAWFPSHELVFKVKKSYNTFVGHLYGDEIGEYTKLRRWLWHAAQAPERTSLNGGENRWRESFCKGIKRRWAAACRELCKCPSRHLIKDEVDDFIDTIEHKYRLYNKKQYGHD